MSTVALHAPGLAQRFAIIVDGLCRTMAARMSRPRYSSDRAAHPLLMLLWSQLRRTMARFARLAERAAAGIPPRPRRDHRAANPASKPTPAPPPPRPPRGSAWLFRLVPEAPVSGSQLAHLLSDPHMADLLRASPELVRLLRPLCHLLAVPDAARLLPPRLRSPRLRPDRLRPDRLLPPQAPGLAAVATSAVAPTLASAPARSVDPPDHAPAPDETPAPWGAAVPDLA